MNEAYMIQQEEKETVNTAGTGSKEVRARILRAAIKEFSLYGLAGARTRRIAEEAGISKALIFYYFKSKKGLYHFMLEDFLHLVNEQLHLRISRSLTMEQILHEIIYTHINIFKQVPEFLAIFRRELADPRNEFVEDMARIILADGLHEQLIDIFEDEIKSGKAREIDISQALISFYSLSIGYLILSPILDRVWKVENKEDFLMTRKYAVVDLFLNGIRAQ